MNRFIPASGLPLAKLNASKVTTLCLALLACWTLAASAARAQPLADRVPADAVLYVGWMGYETKSPGFAGSHLEAVLKAAEFQKFVDVTLPQVLDKVAQKDQQAAQVIGVAMPIVKPMMKYPTAIWIGKPDLVPGAAPTIRAGIVCQAGAESAALHDHLAALLKEAPPEVTQQIKLTKTADSVVVAANYAEGQVPAGANSLAKSPAFAALKPHTVPNACFTIYANVEGLVTIVDDAVTAYARAPEPKEYWPKLRDAVGIKGVKHFIWSSGFDGKEWADHLFLHAPEPRSGFFALPDKPIGDGLLKTIPLTATAAGAFRFDAQAFFAEVVKVVGKVEPRAAQQLEGALADASKKIGMDIEKDVINVFGDEWAYYVDPNVGGRSSLGFVLINKLRDPAKAEQSLAKLGKLMEDELAKAMKMPDMKVRLLSTKSGETTIHYVGTPIISPAWAIRDGHLVVGLFPQVVAGALDQFGSDKSILDNPAFQQVRARLGVAAVSGVSFADLQKTAPDGYSTWLMISRLTGFAEMFGIDAPAMLLPPLNRLLPHLTPAGSVSWSDKAGFHVKVLSPFPGSTLLAQDPLGGGGLILPFAMMGMAQERRMAGRGFDQPPPAVRQERIEPEPVRPAPKPNTIP